MGTDLFAFDLDGTLIHSNSKGERHLPESLRDAIFQIATRAQITVATGRRYRASIEVLKSLPPIPYSVFHNGLLIKDSAGQTVFRALMSESDILQISGACEELGMPRFIVFDGFEVGKDYGFLRSDLDRDEVSQRVYRRVLPHVVVMNRPEEFINSCPILEIAALAPHHELLEARKSLQKKLGKDFKLIVVKNIGYDGLAALEIFRQPHSKWSGVEFVRDALGCKRVIAIGDDENDLEMLEPSDHGVAMGHALDHVQKAANQVVDGVDELREFLLGFYGSKEETDEKSRS